MRQSPRFDHRKDTRKPRNTWGLWIQLAAATAVALTVPSTTLAFAPSSPSRRIPTPWVERSTVDQFPILGPGWKTSTRRLRIDDGEVDPEDLLDYLDQDNLTPGTTFEEYQEQQRRENYLKACPIFTKCSDIDIPRIANAMILQKVAQNERIILQGNTDSAMYFFVRGKLQALDEETGQVYVTYSKQGDFFGELALLFGQPRAASIVATEESTVYRLEKDAFLKSQVDSPVFATAKQIILKKYERQRLRDTLLLIRPDELLGLLKARLSTRSRQKSRLGTLRTFALGAAATWLVTATRVSLSWTNPVKSAAILGMAFVAHLLD